MKANVTISEIYWNKNLSDFFFRSQAYETLEKLVNNATVSGQDVLSILDDKTDGYELDEIEENFYNLSLEELAEMYEIELNNNK